jgi:hypothetical protein
MAVTYQVAEKMLSGKVCCQYVRLPRRAAAPLAADR